MAGASIKAEPNSIEEGGVVTLTAAPVNVDPAVQRTAYRWSVTHGTLTLGMGDKAEWDTTGLKPGMYRVEAELVEYDKDDKEVRRLTGAQDVEVKAGAGPQPEVVRRLVRNTLEAMGDVRARYGFRGGGLPVSLQRTAQPFTRDQVLWMVIRRATQNVSFTEYVRFLDTVLCRHGTGIDTAGTVVTGAMATGAAVGHASRIALPFPGVDAYRRLKAFTEAFVMVNSGVLVDMAELLDGIDPVEEEGRTGRLLTNLDELWGDYLVSINGGGAMLPYLAIIRNKLPEFPVTELPRNGEVSDQDLLDCYGILQEKLSQPIFLELIWSYWHEEGMLVQAMNHISRRFQNVRGPGASDPLADLEIDPLRPLNNLLWGYIQDEQHRLSVVRRAHEYDHEYGFTLHGRAVARLRSAERRSKFLESFHHLLHRCIQFFRQDDDTTVVADGFPILNAIKETHYLLAQGAHNQFGDLPSTARQEMLMQQWLLSRPEMREFLRGRVMVPHPEPWMDRVDQLKTLMGWTDVSVVHFHDLGVFGEQLLLSIRYGGWSVANDPAQAANWARYWRPEIQGYIHAYRAVTGVDLMSDVTDQRQLAEWGAEPAVHLRNRLAVQRRR